MITLQCTEYPTMDFMISLTHNHDNPPLHRAAAAALNTPTAVRTYYIEMIFAHWMYLFLRLDKDVV